MIAITDEFMRQMMSTTKNYCIVILKAGPKRNADGVEKILWEHGRRNFALRAEGVLAIVCPISDGSNVSGVGIFNATVERRKPSFGCLVSSYSCNRLPIWEKFVQQRRR